MTKYSICPPTSSPYSSMVSLNKGILNTLMLSRRIEIKLLTPINSPAKSNPYFVEPRPNIANVKTTLNPNVTKKACTQFSPKPLNNLLSHNETLSHKEILLSASSNRISFAYNRVAATSSFTFRASFLSKHNVCLSVYFLIVLLWKFKNPWIQVSSKQISEISVQLGTVPFCTLLYYFHLLVANMVTNHILFLYIFR